MKKLIVVFLIASFQVDAQMEVKATQSTYLLKVRNQATFNDPLSIISEGNTITLIGYYNDYFTVLHSNDTGYVYYPYINNDILGLADFKSAHSSAHKEFLTKQAIQAEVIKNKMKAEREAEELNSLIKIFGNENGHRVYNNRIWIGMTSRMATLSIGSPEKTNTTKTGTAIREQWVYPNRYLYFENGILTTIQESK